MRAPTSAPLLGLRKVDDAIAPVDVRAPVIVEALVLTKVQVPPRFHELLVLLELPRDWLVPLATDRLRVRVAAASAVSKPVPPLRQAVSRSRTSAPGLALSMKPPAELSQAMLLRATCAAGR